MALLTTTEGLTLGNNGSVTISGGTRWIGLSKAFSNTLTNVFRLAISASNPVIQIDLMLWTTSRVTNDNAVYSINYKQLAWYVDTAGNITQWRDVGDGFGNVGITISATLTTRQIDLYIQSGGANYIMSMGGYILCNRWDFVTMTML